MKGNEQHSTSFVSRCAQGGWLTRSPCSWMICSASGKTQKDWRIFYVCNFLTHLRKCSTRESQRWTTITSCEIQEEKWSPCFKFARRDLSMEWWNIFILVINALRFLTGSQECWNMLKRFNKDIIIYYISYKIFYIQPYSTKPTVAHVWCILVLQCYNPQLSWNLPSLSSTGSNNLMLDHTSPLSNPQSSEDCQTESNSLMCSQFHPLLINVATNKNNFELYTCCCYLKFLLLCKGTFPTTPTSPSCEVNTFAVGGINCR